jgi:PP-loop superfamily ATP-utilizing enzyme
VDFLSCKILPGIQCSKESEGKEPLAKKVKLRRVIEDSGQEWDGIQDNEDRPKGLGKVEEAEEVRARSASRAEVQEKAEEEKGKEKREARREEREARRSEKSEQMKDLIQAVRDLGDKVDRFADEVRVSNVLRNREDREYLEEQRHWYFSDRLANARDWNKDSEQYSV